MRMHRHQVLLAGVNDEVARQLVLRLNAFGVDFVRVPWGEASSRVATNAEFDAIVIAYPTEEPGLEQVLRGLRSVTSLSRYSGVVVLCRGRQLKHVRRLVGRGVDRAVSLADPDETWRDAVLDLIDVARRFPLRVPVDVATDIERGLVTASCRTENVSISGMLLCCSNEIPVGATMSFALAVSGEQDPIRGEARVTRTTNRDREGIDGIGAAFVSFMEADGSRLRNVLARHTA